MNFHRAALLSALLGASVLWAAPAPSGDDPAERQSLARQRDEVEARFAQESQACLTLFSVNACAESARVRRNASLAPLQARQAALDAEQRRLRAGLQGRRVAERQQQLADLDGKRPVDAVLAPASAAAAEPRPQRGLTPSRIESLRVKDEQARRAADRAVEQMTARQRQMQQHQQDVLRRNEQRQAQGRKPAAPLPSPLRADHAASAASAR